MNVTLSCQQRKTVTIPAIPSKSHVHRLLICAALADGVSRIHCPVTSEDMDATVRCMNALGAHITRENDAYVVTPIGYAGDTENAHANAVSENATPTLDCGESGSTMRFLLPVVCALGKGRRLYAHGRLPERPLSPLYEELVRHGALLSPAGKNPLSVSGKLTPGDYTLDGSVSSQFITGLLFALPLLDGSSTLTITGRVESAPYITMTLDALSMFGVHWQKIGAQSYRIEPTRYHTPGKVTAEGDWSNAAFWLVAGALSETSVTVTGLRMDSIQGDRAIVTLLAQMGASVETGADRVTVSGGHLHGIELDGTQIPDLIPILSIAAACAKGVTTMRQIGRLRLKESDRIAAVVDMLTSLGCHGVTAGEDWLRIEGGRPFSGGVVDGWHDHRIVMSSSVAAWQCTGSVEIVGAEAVRKSYPGFFGDLRQLGKIELREME